jgi:hypothetical protein
MNPSYGNAAEAGAAPEASEHGVVPTRRQTGDEWHEHITPHTESQPKHASPLDLCAWGIARGHVWLVVRELGRA